MKEKYGDTLQVNGVVGEEDDESVEESNEPLQYGSQDVSLASKLQGSVQVTVELPQHPGTP